MFHAESSPPYRTLSTEINLKVKRGEWIARLHHFISGLVELLRFVFLVVPVHKVGHENDQLDSEGPKEHSG